MLSKQQHQKEYVKLYREFEKAFHKMFNYAEKHKVGGLEEAVHLAESIDEWAVSIEGCIDLCEENKKLREKLGLDDCESID